MPAEKPFDEILNEIGFKLYTLRHARREKLTTVAKSIGVSHPVISQIENGRYKCLSLELLAKLAQHYEVPLQNLVSEQLSIYKM